MNPVIEIVIVGNEILSGRTMDRNARHMTASLAGSGYPVSFMSVVGDRIDEIAGVLGTAARRADIVLVSGGLGPTSDDVTVEAAALAFGRRIVLDEDVLEWIRSLFRRRKWFMSDSNKKQAMIPQDAEPIVNPVGTAPCISMKVAGKNSPARETTVYLMPGIPLELQTIFDSIILPRIKNSYEPDPFESAAVYVTGIGESLVYDTIKHLPGAQEAFSFYPRYSGIEIRIQTDEHSPVPAKVLQDTIVSLLGDNVYSTYNEILEEEVAVMLFEKNVTIAVAESCTGGLIAHRLTNIPGSSQYFLCGVVAYSNEAKQTILGVDPELIAAYGAVSEEVSAAMAEGVRKIAGSAVGLSTTGIAGPGGGSEKKPVGLMYTSISSAGGIRTKKLQFAEDRLINKNRMSQVVLDNLRRYLLKT